MQVLQVVKIPKYNSCVDIAINSIVQLKYSIKVNAIAGKVSCQGYKEQCARHNYNIYIILLYEAT